MGTKLKERGMFIAVSFTTCLCRFARVKNWEVLGEAGTVCIGAGMLHLRELRVLR